MGNTGSSPYNLNVSSRSSDEGRARRRRSSNPEVEESNKYGWLLKKKTEVEQWKSMYFTVRDNAIYGSRAEEAGRLGLGEAGVVVHCFGEVVDVPESSSYRGMYQFAVYRSELGPDEPQRLDLLCGAEDDLREWADAIAAVSEDRAVKGGNQRHIFGDDVEKEGWLLLRDASSGDWNPRVFVLRRTHLAFYSLRLKLKLNLKFCAVYELLGHGSKSDVHEFMSGLDGGLDDSIVSLANSSKLSVMSAPRLPNAAAPGQGPPHQFVLCDGSAGHRVQMAAHTASDAREWLAAIFNGIALSNFTVKRPRGFLPSAMSWPRLDRAGYQELMGGATMFVVYGMSVAQRNRVISDFFAERSAADERLHPSEWIFKVLSEVVERIPDLQDRLAQARIAVNERSQGSTRLDAVLVKPYMHVMFDALVQSLAREVMSHQHRVAMWALFLQKVLDSRVHHRGVEGGLDAMQGILSEYLLDIDASAVIARVMEASDGHANSDTSSNLGLIARTVVAMQSGRTALVQGRHYSVEVKHGLSDLINSLRCGHLKHLFQAAYESGPWGREKGVDAVVDYASQTLPLEIPSGVLERLHRLGVSMNEEVEARDLCEALSVELSDIALGEKERLVDVHAGQMDAVVHMPQVDTEFTAPSTGHDPWQRGNLPPKSSGPGSHYSSVSNKHGTIDDTKSSDIGSHAPRSPGMTWARVLMNAHVQTEATWDTAMTAYEARLSRSHVREEELKAQVAEMSNIRSVAAKLQEEVKEKTDLLAKAEREVTKFKAIVGERDAEIDRLEEEATLRKGELLEAKSGTQELVSVLERARERIRELEGMMTTKDEEHKAAMGEIASLIGAVETISPELDRLKEDSKAEMDRLTDRMKALRLEKNDMATENKRLSALVSEAEGLRAQMADDLEKKNDERTQLQREVDKFSARAERLAQELSIQEQETERMEFQLKDLKREQAATRRAAEDLKETESDLEASRNEAKALQRALAEKERALEEATQNTLRIEKSQGMDHRQLQEAQSDLIRLRSELKTQADACITLEKQVEQLTERNTDQLAEMSTLRAEVSQLHRREGSFNDQLLRKDEEINSLRRSYEVASSEKDRLHETLTKARDDALRGADECRQHRHQLEVIQRELAHAQAQLESKATELRVATEQHDVMRAEREKVFEDLMHVRNSEAEIMSELSRLRGEFTFMSKKAGRLEEELGTAEERVHSTTAQMATKEDDLRALKRDREAEVTKLEGEVQRLTTTLEWKDKLLSEKDTALQDLQKDATELRSQVAELEFKCTKQDQERSELVAGMEGLDSEVQELRTSGERGLQALDELQERHDGLAKEFDEMTKELRATTSEKERFQSEASKAAEEIASLKAELETVRRECEDTLSSERVEADQTVEELNERHSRAMESTTAKFEEEFRGLSDEISTITSEKETLITEVELLERRLSECLDKIERHEGKIAEGETERVRLGAELEGLKEKCADADERTREKDTELAQQVKETVRVMEEVSALKQAVEMKDKDLYKVGQDLAAVTMELEHAEKDKSSLEKKYRRSKAVGNEATRILEELAQLKGHVREAEETSAKYQRENGALELELNRVNVEKGRVAATITDLERLLAQKDLDLKNLTVRLEQTQEALSRAEIEAKRQEQRVNALESDVADWQQLAQRAQADEDEEESSRRNRRASVAAMEDVLTRAEEEKARLLAELSRAKDRNVEQSRELASARMYQSELEERVQKLENLADNASILAERAREQARAELADDMEKMKDELASVQLANEDASMKIATLEKEKSDLNVILQRRHSASMENKETELRELLDDSMEKYRKENKRRLELESLIDTDQALFEHTMFESRKAVGKMLGLRWSDDRERVNIAMALLKAEAIILNRDGSGMLDKILSKMERTQDIGAVFKQAQVKIKKEVVGLTGEHDPGDRWRISTEDLKKVPSHTLKNIRQGIEELVVMYDCLSESYKQTHVKQTTLEIVRNAPTLLAITRYILVKQIVDNKAKDDGY